MIGNFSEDADIFLPHEDLSLSKLRISLEGSTFIAVNLANDPFTSVNGNPFGKTELSHSDILHIGDTSIRGVTYLTHEEPIALEVSADEDQLEELSSLFQQVEELQTQQPAPETFEQEIIPNTPEPEKFEEIEPTIQNDYREANRWCVREDDHEDLKDPEPPEPPPKSGSKLKFMLVGLIILLLGLLIAMGFSYYEYNKKVIEEERKAARAITDVTLALAYAKINHIKPSKQNWSSPDFLNHNLQGVLSKKYPPTIEVNSQGQIGDTSYILRIYTDSDLSGFLIIAQPGHNLSQWWIPKSAIIVDSKEMVIRKMKDLRGLNRLLTNPQPLDGKNGELVFDLVKTGDIIPLASLASRRQSNGFSPPKALAMLRPGAENYIYNAPRYYPLTESILKKTYILKSKSENSLDVTMLLNDIESLTVFPDIVFYSSEGIGRAIEAQNILKTLLPEKKLLVAYLKYNMRGKEVNNNLLISDDTTHALFEEYRQSNASETSFSDNDHIDTEAFTSDDFFSGENRNVPPLPVKITGQKPKKREYMAGDTTHPFYLKLLKLKSERENELKPHQEKIKNLLADHKNTIIVGFSLLVRDALRDYESADRSQQIRILKDLHSLYQEHSDIPLEKIMQYVDQNGMGELVRDSLKKKEMVKSDPVLSEDAFNTQMSKISSSKYLEELEHHVEQTFDMLTISRLPNIEKLISFQNMARYHVLNKLKDFLLSPDLKLPLESFHPETEGILVNILHKSWVFEPTEYHFFLNEFDQLSSGE